MADPVSTPAEPGPVPVPARTWANPLFGVAAIVVTVAGLQAFGGLLGPLFLAVVLIITVHPVGAALRRRGFPSWLATIVTLVGVYAILLALVGSLVYAVAELARVLPGYGPEFNSLITDARALLLTLGIGPREISTALSQFNIGTVLGPLQGFLGGLAGVLSTVVLILSVLLFMATDAASFPARLRAVGQSRPHVVDALVNFAHGTRRFLAVSTVFGLIVAGLDVIVLWVLGVPLALLFGLLSLIANYVPNIGFVLALVPPAIIALLEGGPSLMFAVIVSFLVINVLLQTIIQPRFVGDAVGLSVTITFLALVFWGFVIGPLGALLAIPLTLLAKALLVDLHPRTRWLTILISDDPPTEPRVGQAPAAAGGAPA